MRPTLQLFAPIAVWLILTFTPSAHGEGPLQPCTNALVEAARNIISERTGVSRDDLEFCYIGYHYEVDDWTNKTNRYGGVRFWVKGTVQHTLSPTNMILTGSVLSVVIDKGDSAFVVPSSDRMSYDHKTGASHSESQVSGEPTPVRSSLIDQYFLLPDCSIPLGMATAAISGQDSSAHNDLQFWKFSYEYTADRGDVQPEWTSRLVFKIPSSVRQFQAKGERILSVDEVSVLLDLEGRVKTNGILKRPVTIQFRSGDIVNKGQ